MNNLTLTLITIMIACFCGAYGSKAYGDSQVKIAYWNSQAMKSMATPAKVTQFVIAKEGK